MIVVLTALPGDRHISMRNVTLLRSTIDRPGAISVAGQHDDPAAAFGAARLDPRENAGHGDHNLYVVAPLNPVQR